MNYRAILLLAALLASLHTSAGASCPALYLNGTPPYPLAPDVVELCNDQYASRWDPRSHNPQYVVEVLQGDLLRGLTQRTNDFRGDDRISDQYRVEADEYAGTGYDRGHMAPAGDSVTPRAMSQSFLMSNVVPQNRLCNRGPWARVEEATRSLVVSVVGGRGYVVTGPLYWGDHLTAGRAWVPTKLFKAVYVPGDRFGNTVVVGAWVADNADEANVEFVSLARLRERYGVDAFPSLPEGLKAVAQVPDTVLSRVGAVRR
jgi:endonuclease G